MSKKLLKREGKEYVEIDITEDADGLAKIKELGYLQAPVVITDTGEHWSGFNPDKIKAI